MGTTEPSTKAAVAAAQLQVSAMERVRRMNVPNKLTISRFVLTVAFLGVFFSQVRFGNTVSLILFSAASLTDYFDGKIARRDKLITNFGILMDPLADKILTCSAFIAFVDRDLMPAWMVVIIVARELAITGLRLLAASKHVVLAAEGYGKHKTISQIVAIVSILTLLSYPEWGSWTQLVFAWWVPIFTQVAKWVTIILTFTSGALYLWRNRSLYLDDLG
jgi:CDP-diacylglycerol---glycerol-3-phosphate 3-phosphatidyltransferase